MVTIDRGARGLGTPSVPVPSTLTLIPFDPPGPGVTLQLLTAGVLDPGNPRWNELERPRRQSVLEWAGRSALRQTLTVMFSGAVNPATGDQATVTPQVSQLQELAMPWDESEPPLLHAVGPVYGNSTGYAWRIETLTPGEPRRNRAGDVCQVTYDIALVRHLYTDIVANVAAQSPAAAAMAAAGSPPVGQAKTHTVVKGETLARIAQRTLGSANRWREIATLNGLRDPNKLTVGQVLKLP